MRRENHISIKITGLSSKITICLLLSFVFEISAPAQEPLIKTEYSYRRYTTADGLPDLITFSIFQDSKGFIWVGSMKGLARFDGQEFKKFDSKKMSIIGFAELNRSIMGIGSNSSYNIDEDESVTQVGMVRYMSDIYCWHNSKTLPNGYGVYQIDNKKALYEITDTGLIKTWEHELLNQMGEGDNLYWDKPNKRFFIPTEEQGVFIVKEDGTIEKNIAVNNIANFIPYKDYFMAVGYNGLYEYKDNKIELVHEYPFFNGESADLQLLEDSEHNLIIRTSSSLYRYGKGKLEIITDKLLSSWNMFIDKEGNIWIAAANGLFNFYKLNFKNYILLPEGSITQSIVVDKNNRLWIPSLDGRIFRIEKEKKEQIKYPTSPYDYSFFQTGSIAKDNLLYLPGGCSILKYDCNKEAFKWLPDFPLYLINFISILPNECLLAGNTMVAMIYNPAEGITHTYEADKLKQYILTSYTDKQGNIILGGGSGLTFINGDSIHCLFGDSLEMCTYITPDKNGKLWLICGNNLVSMENDNIKIEHTFKKDLCNLHITRDGIMIVTTDNELFLSPDIEKLNFIRYDQNNGYYNAFGIPSTNVAEDKDGNIYISTMEKVVSFNPKELLNKIQPPRLYLQKSMNSTDNIRWESFDMNKPTMSYRHNNIRFTPVALSFAATENIRYHYRLVGFQNEWSEPVKNREITFNNLPPGDYIFEVYSDSGTDESICETQTFSFSIIPAFWQTAWFLFACIASLIIMSTGVTIYIQRRKNKALLEKLRAEKELNELRISSIRLKAIPHFNANVLAAIEYYIANRTKEEAMRLLSIYSDFTYQTLSEVDKASRPLSEELAYVKMYLELEKIRFRDKFDFRIELDDEVNENVELPNMILHTYCENAVKHGLMPRKSGGLLIIHVSQQEQIVCVNVEDNGIGRAAASQSTHIRSSKQGLSILNRQIEIYNKFNHAKINQQVEDLINDNIACGTRFTVEVPVNFNYLN